MTPSDESAGQAHGPRPLPGGQQDTGEGAVYLLAVEPSEEAWLGNHQLVPSKQNRNGVLKGKLGSICRTHLQFGNPSFQILAVAFFFKWKPFHKPPYFITVHLIFLFFNWSKIEFQCCMNFCCTVKWLSYTYICILFHILCHYGLSQDIESSSLCYTVGPCCLSILYIPVCIC